MSTKKSHAIRISNDTAKRLMRYEGRSWNQRVRRALEEAGIPVSPTFGQLRKREGSD